MINQVSPSAHLLYSVYIMCGRQSVQVMISHTALLPGDVFEAAAPAVLPLECVGHHDDMPVADGPLQGQCATLTFIISGRESMPPMHMAGLRVLFRPLPCRGVSQDLDLHYAGKRL